MHDDVGPPSRVITQRVACDWRRAWRVAADPRRLPAWASGLSQGRFIPDGDHWCFEAADGRIARVRFAPPNDWGVLDHWVQPEGPDAAEVYVPLRVIAVAEGVCEFQFTLLRQPDMDDAAMARDAAWVARDLQALKALLEAAAPD